MSDATTDPKARLSHDQILEAGLDDWRKVLDRLKARFRTGDSIVPSIFIVISRKLYSSVKFSQKKRTLFHSAGSANFARLFPNFSME